MEKRAAKLAYIRLLEARATETMPLLPRTPTALEIACCALTNRVCFGHVWDGREALTPADELSRGVEVGQHIETDDEASEDNGHGWMGVMVDAVDEYPDAIP